MAFTKGHPYHPPKDGVAPLGVTKDTRRRLKNLAVVIREGWPPEEMFRWLREVAAGRDPDRPPPKDGEPDFGLAPLDWAVRMRAAKMLLERALGQPAQHLLLEAELKAAIGTVAVQVASQDLKKVDSAALEVLRAALNQVVRPAGANGQVIPAHSTEVRPHMRLPASRSAGGNGDGPTATRVEPDLDDLEDRDDDE